MENNATTETATATAAEHEHTWIVLVAHHGPDAPYGCQTCPATATGTEIGVTRQQGA